MRFISRAVLLAVVCFFAVVLAAGAMDYKNWLDLLPDKIDGLSPSGEPTGVNMESGGQQWSSLEQDYAGQGERQIRLIIVSGAMAPQVRTFQNMPQFNMESEVKLAKSLQVNGHRAFLELDKPDASGRVVVSVQEQTIVVVEAEPVETAEQMVSLAEEVPLGRFAKQIP